MVATRRLATNHLRGGKLRRSGAQMPRKARGKVDRASSNPNVGESSADLWLIGLAGGLQIQLYATIRRWCWGSAHA